MRRRFLAILAVVGLSSCVVKFEPGSVTMHVTPATTPVDSPEYRVPTVAGITGDLDRIKGRLDANAPVRIVGDAMDAGPEKKFAPLHYTMGVIDSGLLAAAEATGDKRFEELVVKQFEFYRAHLRDALAAVRRGSLEPEAARPKDRGALWNLARPDALDWCGAIGTAMIQAKLAGVGPDMSEVIGRWAEYVHREQYRLPDGTLARERPFAESVWLDDAYMGAPILAEMGKLSGDHSYSDDGARQMELFYKHLFVPEAGVFTHGIHLGKAGDQPRYCWGRANGWYAMAMVTVLDALPENHPEREKLIEILRRAAKGWASCQSGSGLWHQMLDREDSYLETSCSAMFTFAIARGVNRGWLDAGTYGPVAIAGWNGVETRITADGRVNGTCVGTSYAADYNYYYARPAGDDAHGYGPVLLAGAEMIRLLENPGVRIEKWGSGPIMVNARER